jgi:hypothetical protein
MGLWVNAAGVLDEQVQQLQVVKAGLGGGAVQPSKANWQQLIPGAPDSWALGRPLATAHSHDRSYLEA